MRQMAFALAALLAAEAPAPPASCLKSYASVERELSAARARWSSSGITTYNYRLSRLCLCDARVAGPFRVRVEDAAVRAAIYQGAAASGVADGTRVADEDLVNVMTIDRLFNVIAGAVAKKACTIDVAYDPTLGYPTKIDIDLDAETADEEVRYAISDVRPASSSAAPTHSPR
jgi:hypothetical protein